MRRSRGALLQERRPARDRNRQIPRDEIDASRIGDPVRQRFSPHPQIAFARGRVTNQHPDEQQRLPVRSQIPSDGLPIHLKVMGLRPAPGIQPMQQGVLDVETPGALLELPRHAAASTHHPRRGTSVR